MAVQSVYLHPTTSQTTSNTPLKFKRLHFLPPPPAFLIYHHHHHHHHFRVLTSRLDILVVNDQMQNMFSYGQYIHLADTSIVIFNTSETDRRRSALTGVIFCPGEMAGFVQIWWIHTPLCKAPFIHIWAHKSLLTNTAHCISLLTEFQGQTANNGSSRLLCQILYWLSYIPTVIALGTIRCLSEGQRDDCEENKRMWGWGAVGKKLVSTHCSQSLVWSLQTVLKV